jgi:ribosomal protein S18 acetylase RimI-like enzyme
MEGRSVNKGDRSTAGALVIDSRTDATAMQAARELFTRYERSVGGGVCFGEFEAELDSLPGDYEPPSGRLLIAWRGKDAVGCVALRDLGDGDCEMKRLWVEPAAQGSGLGRRLVVRLLEEARSIGYRRVRLDTMPVMRAAQSLYESLGFEDSEPHRPPPQDDLRFMALEL